MLWRKTFLREIKYFLHHFISHKIVSKVMTRFWTQTDATIDFFILYNGYVYICIQLFDMNNLYNQVYILQDIIGVFTYYSVTLSRRIPHDRFGDITAHILLYTNETTCLQYFLVILRRCFIVNCSMK